MDEKYLLAISTMTEEQYNKFFKNLPIPYSVIKSNPQKFIQILSNNNESLKNLLNDFLKNNIQVVNVVVNGENVNFSINIDINNEIEKKFSIQIREKMNLNSEQFNVKPRNNGKGIVQIDISVNQLKDILDFNNLVEDYFSVNKNTESIPYEEINCNLMNEIMEQYSVIPEDVIDLVHEQNKKEIMHVIEKDKEKSNFINPNAEMSYTRDVAQNNIDMEYLHSIDPIYKAIPFSKMTEEMKKTMFNRYFRMEFNEKISDLQKRLQEQSKTRIEFKYQKQQQKDLDKNGIAGNTRSFDSENNITTIDIFSHSNLEYFKVVDDKISINEDLLGQAMISMLHEYRHTQQQKAIRDNVQNNKLVNAIKEFELKCESDLDYYNNNYKEDPAEIDANFFAFHEFKRMALQYGIHNPEDIILDITEIVRNAEEEAFRFYDSKKFESYEDVMAFLKDKLHSKFKPLQHEESISKKEDLTKSNTDKSEYGDKKDNVEVYSRSYLSQINPEIKNSNYYINYIDYKRIDNGKSQIESSKNPLVNEKKEVIGESEEISVYDYKTSTTKTNIYETIEENDEICVVDTETMRKGNKFGDIISINSTMTSGKEKSNYVLDENGKETYSFIDNGEIQRKITKTEKGTTIDIYKDGKPYETFEYDENGKALIPMGNIEQLPNDYVEEQYKKSMPKYIIILNEEKNQTIDTTKLGKETLDMQKDKDKIANIEDQIGKHMREQTQQRDEDSDIAEFEKNTKEEKKNGFKESMRVNIDTNEYVQKILNEVKQDLDNGTLNQETGRNNDDHKVENGDDDYIM